MADQSPGRQRGDRTRLLALVADSGNRRVLTDWIGDHDRYELAEGGPDTATFELCILDSEMLEREAATLTARKEETSTIVPVLLVVPDGQAASVHKELRQERPALWDLVDGTLRMPVHEYELADQVDTLLELRSQSETLIRQREQLEILNRVLRHDIRNDMTVVLGWLEYVAERTSEELTAEFDRIESSAEHIVELTTAAGDIAKSMRSDAEPKLEPTALTRVLIDEVEKRQNAFDEATIELPESPPHVTVAANELLSSVFRNLINNAVQHNDADEPVVSITVRELDSHVQVRIEDNGPGVPETLGDDIFDDEMKGMESSGTGMGLYLVSTLIDLYGGEVWVEDNDPRGSVFCVELETIDHSTVGTGE